MPEPKYQVFLSSTKKDLSEAREDVTWELLKLGFIPVGMENFSAQPDRGWKVIKKTIDLSDYYVVIVAGRYGTFDAESGKSWTQREYEYALERGVPVFAFVRAWSEIRATDLDDGERKERLDAFRDALSAAHLREEWTSIDDLRARVGAALSKAVREDAQDGTTRPGWYRGPVPALNELAALSAEARTLRERLAALPQQSRAIELLKAMPKGTPLMFAWTNLGGISYIEDGFLESIDEARNVLIATKRKGAGAPATFPLDKVDTVFPSVDGRHRVCFHPFA